LDENYLTGRRKPGVKIELSKLKGDAYKDQLTPFDGLWGFSPEMDYYHGTIFRFPLRTAQSALRPGKFLLDSIAVREKLDEFLRADGRVSLLFLENIRTIDFTIYGEAAPQWSIMVDAGIERDIFGRARCMISKCMNGLTAIYEDNWWINIQNLTQVPTEYQYHYQTNMKREQCGIAAWIPPPKDKEDTVFSNAPVPRFFSTLPLPLPLKTELPVHIHASFLLPSHRNSVTIEHSAREEGADWNKWLLTDPIPKLYLEFLNHLAMESHEPGMYYQYWPQTRPQGQQHSDLIYSSFWDMLPNSSCRLFPASPQFETTLAEGRRTEITKTKRESSKRFVDPDVLEINVAMFDLLPADQSEVLNPVLGFLIPKLVRVPLGIREELLSRKIEVNLVSPASLRKLFQSHNASEALEKAAIKNPDVLETLLRIIKPVSDHEFKELDGCRVLQLADGSLGTLRLIDTIKCSDYYYSANHEEIKLFDFASGLLVDRLPPGKDLKRAVLVFNQFNVTQLSLSRIGKLLERQWLKESICTNEMNAWLSKFWQYWRRNDDKEGLDVKTTFMSDLGIHQHPVFEATCRGKSNYINPEMLGTLASVIDPNNLQERKLCDKFPGLHIFNRNFLPTYLRAEESLNNLESFVRLIKSISGLAKLERICLDVYIKKYLHPGDLEVLSTTWTEYHVQLLTVLDVRHFRN
jgi:sacsin